MRVPRRTLNRFGDLLRRQYKDVIVDFIPFREAQGGYEILIQRRAPHRAVFPNAWEFPGGHFDPGESLADCIERLVEEESGTELDDILALVHHFDWDDGATSNLQFIVKSSGSFVANQAKISEFRWIDASALDMLLTDRGETPIQRGAFYALEYLANPVAESSIFWLDRIVSSFCRFVRHDVRPPRLSLQHNSDESQLAVGDATEVVISYAATVAADQWSLCLLVLRHVCASFLLADLEIGADVDGRSSFELLTQQFTEILVEALLLSFLRSPLFTRLEATLHPLVSAIWQGRTDTLSCGDALVDLGGLLTLLISDWVQRQCVVIPALIAEGTAIDCLLVSDAGLQRTTLAIDGQLSAVLRGSGDLPLGASPTRALVDALGADIARTIVSARLPALPRIASDAHPNPSRR